MMSTTLSYVVLCKNKRTYKGSVCALGPNPSINGRMTDRPVASYEAENNKDSFQRREKGSSTDINALI